MGNWLRDIDALRTIDEEAAKATNDAPWLLTGEHPAHPEVAGQPAPE